MIFYRKQKNAVSQAIQVKVKKVNSVLSLITYTKLTLKKKRNDRKSTSNIIQNSLSAQLLPLKFISFCVYFLLAKMSYKDFHLVQVVKKLYEN